MNESETEERVPAEVVADPEATAVEVRQKIRRTFEREKRTGAFRTMESVRRAGASETEMETLSREFVAENLSDGDLADGWRRMRMLHVGTEEEQRAVGALAYTHQRFVNPDAARSIASDLWGPESDQVREIDAEQERTRGKRRTAPARSHPVFDDAWVSGLREAIVRLVGSEHEHFRIFESNMAARRGQLGTAGEWSEPVSEVDEADGEPVTIAPDATFADLFAAIDASGEAVEEVFFSELHDSFSEELIDAIEAIRTDVTLAAMSRVVEFFRAHGISQRDLTAALPIRFSRTRR